ncbi:hypothetical protein H0H81_006140 [Sphagnurus paluster]|uniref:Pseudouridine synthase I TruA alpha/beta domain-containing protein n=1 Tax=Sphagnurus paluster TaxID=117069 RepID=A0A9P7FTW3_9AGAR|nr:hypothetical protein H0H81_006140 [Sphagnurus paluster]
MASPPPPSTSPYDGWTREELIARLTQLDRDKSRPNQQPPSPKRREKHFHFSVHSRRKIALKFCYSGWEYGGLAFQKTETALPTVEGVLFDAMVKARLVDPEAGFDGCGWEKCGRTDRGVSAAGQVISLWIRSTLGTEAGGEDGTLDVATRDDVQEMSNTTPKAGPSLASPAPNPVSTENQTAIPGLEFGFEEDDLDAPQSNSSLSIPPPTHRTIYEHNYLAILNRLLPPTIRVLAWSPVSTQFSARFSCTYRHYKYFFSSDTVPGPVLDIDRMRTAASHLVGEHDFRNMCKLDPAKQITSFRRKVMRADIEPVSVDASGRGMYVFNLVGSAFLYHQVRHIMAVLFMVGHGQEDPAIVPALMNVEEGAEPGANEVVNCKPEYQMADALPLLLWDCGYPEEELDWRTTNGAPGSSESRPDLYQQLHSIHARSQVYTALNDHFLAAASVFHRRPAEAEAQSPSTKLLIPLGGGAYKRTGQDKYVPLLRRNRLDPVEQVNERWRLGKGFRRNERKKAAEDIDDVDGNE